MPMRDRLARLVQRNPERPTLRQRAAALKASAAKVMRQSYRFDGLLAFDIDAALAADGLAGHPDCPVAVAADASEPDAVGAPVAGPDADLIALSRQFSVAHAAWMALVPASDAAHDQVEAFHQRAVSKGMDETDAFKAAWLQDGVTDAHEAEEAAFVALEPLNEAIMALPAHTVEGLAVKARAAIPTVWASGSFEADRAQGARENWERRGVRDLIDACMMLARRQPVSGDETPTESAAASQPDLSKLSIVQLRNLYDRYVQVSDLWNDALHASWTKQADGPSFRASNAAGDLIEAEQTRICDLYLAVVAELSSRTPSDGFETSWRLETLIRHELMCNGDLREAPELRAAIAERWSA